MLSCAAIGNRRGCQFPTGTQLNKPRKRTRGRGICARPRFDLDAAPGTPPRPDIIVVSAGENGMTRLGPKAPVRSFVDHIRGNAREMNCRFEIGSG
jgi:hypothetical protein